MASILGKFSLKKTLIILAIVFIGGIVIYTLTRPKPLLSKAGVVLKRYSVTRQDLENVVSLSGTVDADEKVTLQFQSSGKLNWVGVKEGDTVSKWQVIASLDQRQLKKSLERQLKDFQTQRLTVDQFRDDNKPQNIGESNTYLTDRLTRLAQTNQNTLDKTIIDVELGNLSLELANLVTPIAGIVTHIDQPLAGVNITPATARFSIVNPQTLFMHATLDQQDVALIAKGMKATILFDAFPDEPYTGEVTYVAYAPDAGDSNSYAVSISIPEKIKPQLKLSMGAEMSISTKKKNSVIAVPVEAITDENGKKYVTKAIDEKTTTKQQIFTGLETDTFVEVVRGLRENDTIVY